ncbi:hypothetical protein ACLFMI_24370 [Pseudonocardia nantongensis]|uniref:hypothetical protein n=1 Tax=Pseudonocardia nantongensis TaxID=1181885 RepID=UPI003978126A
MTPHGTTRSRTRFAALAAATALAAAGGALALGGTGYADPLPALTTTTVGPDLEPFTISPTGAGTAELSDAFGGPPEGGAESLRLETPEGTDKVQALTEVSGVDAPLAAWIPTAAYSAFQAEADNPIQFPSLQLVVDFNGPDADGGFSTLTYEPVYNDGDDTTAGQWNRYEAGTGNWCSTRAIPGVIEETQRQCSNGGAKPLSDYVAGSPAIVVGAVQINQGSGNPGLLAGVDLVSTPSTTYDFETPEPTDPESPGKPGDPEHPDKPEHPGKPGDPGHPDDGGHGHKPGTDGNCPCK